MCRRLGVSPGPVGLNGPAIIDAVDLRNAVGLDRVDVAPATARSTVGLRAPVFSTKVTPMACGPALTGTRAFSRVSKLSAEAGFASSVAQSSRPPTVVANTRTPSTLNSTP